MQMQRPDDQSQRMVEVANRYSWRLLIRTVCVVGITAAVFHPPEMANHSQQADAADNVLAQKRKTQKKRNNKTRRAGKSRNKKRSKQSLPKPKTRKITIAKVDPKTLDQVLESAARIDRLVQDNYKKHGVKPNDRTTNEQFVRRIYLDVTGTIPTLRQVDTFLRSRSDDKRSKLIDALLNSPGYASHYFNYWADILRLQERLVRRLPGSPYQEWVKKSLESNKPFDRMVYELITAEGKLWENAATGYILRDAGMPLDNMSNTVRIFLGTQIGCAQCHDHPFDRWTQKDFYQTAAYTFGTQTLKFPSQNGKKRYFRQIFKELEEELKDLDPKFRRGNQYLSILQANRFVVYDNDRRRLRLPDDYQYDNAAPKSVVQPRTLFGQSPTSSSGDVPRIVFARWLTSPENPRFALTIANRLWKQCFGIGQYEPIDNIRDESEPENAELMDFLSAEMIRVGFDMKEFLRILLNTKVYQRQATVEEVTPGEEYHFPGPILRRMSAEQIWDSLITLAVINPGGYQRRPSSIDLELYNVDPLTVTAKELFQRREKYLEDTGRLERRGREANHRYHSLLLVRASELPSPTPAGHFLRQFGQSDRELIETSSRDGSIPQVLQMFNGPITHSMLERQSLMYRKVTRQKKLGDQINVIFKSILSRTPTKEQFQIARQEINANGLAGYGNVIWALVNTREFLFIQ